MKTSLKKIFLLIAVVVTAVVCFAFSADALESTGQCGDNVYWEYDLETKELIISGEGDMYYYSPSESSPFVNSNEIRSVIIEDGVTSIGSYAFCNSESIETVSLGSDIKEIAYFAFSDCINLKSIDFSLKLTKIGEYAFESCVNLKEVILPDSLIDLGHCSFQYCYNIEKLVLSKNLTVLNSYTFVRCEKLKSVIIPEGMKTIGWGAFKRCYALENVTIPDTVEKIDTEAFVSADKIYALTLPDNISEIGNNSFSDNTALYCKKDSVTESILRDTDYKYALIDGNDDESIFGETISDFSWSLDKRTGVLEVVGTGEMLDFISIDAPWYDLRYFITSVNIDSSFTTIGDNAFKDLYRVKNVVIPECVVTIGESSFDGCASLDSITFPDGLVSIGDDAFSECSSIKSVDFPDTLVAIGSYAFYKCSNITSVSIPYSVKELYDSFRNCVNLTSFVFELDENHTSYLERMPVLTGTKIKEIVLPASINQSREFPADIEKVTVYNPDFEFEDDCGLNYKSTICGFKNSTAEAFAKKIKATFVDIEAEHNHQYKNVTEKGYCPYEKCICGKIKDKEKHKDVNYDALCDKCKTNTNDIEVGVPLSIAFVDNEDLSLSFIPSKWGKYTFKMSDGFSGHLSLYYQDFDIQEHSDDDKSLVKNINAGSKVYLDIYSSDICLAELSVTFEEIEPCSQHTKDYYYESTGASCEKDGYLKYRCYKCDGIYTDITPATGHKYYVEARYEANCSIGGFVDYRCSKCRNGYSETIPATGKHSIVTNPAVPATYSTTGKTASTYCSVCYTYFAERKIIPKLVLGKVTGLKTKAVTLASGTKSTLTLMWNKVADAEKYEVYQQSGKKWTKVGTTAKNTITVKKLKANKSYKFKVRAIRSDATGAYSTVFTGKTVPLSTTVTLKAGKKQLTATWKTVSGATGYEVQYSTSKKFTKKTTKTVTIKKAKTKKTTIKKLKKGKKYFVRVRAYKTVNKKPVYGAWSAVKNVKIK